MSITDKLVWLYKFGHAWNPDYPNLLNADETAIRKMNGTERDAKDMVSSFQKLDNNVERLVNAFHGRALEPDGEIGPATDTVMNFKRCGIPDYAPPPGASFEYGDPSLNGAVKSYQEYKQYSVEGNGSWPSCDPQRQDVHSCRVGLVTSGFSSHQKSLLPKIIANVEATEAEIGFAVRHILEATKKDVEKFVTSKNIPGGVIGYCYFPVPDTCNQTIEAYIDNTFDASEYTLSELLTHEYDGHGDGLEHTNGGIMNPSIGRPVKRPTWIGDNHERTKKKYFTGVPLSPPNNPSTHPEFIGEIFGETGPNGIAIRGVTSLTLKPNHPAGVYKYICVPGSAQGRFKFEPKSEV